MRHRGHSRRLVRRGRPLAAAHRPRRTGAGPCADHRVGPAQPAGLGGHRGGGALHRHPGAHGPLARGPGPDGQAGRLHRQRGQRRPAGARHRGGHRAADGVPAVRQLPAAAAGQGTERRRACRTARPARPLRRAARAPLPRARRLGRRPARRRQPGARRVPAGGEGAPGRAGRRRAAARPAHPRLRLRLQAGADQRRLLSGGLPRERRAGLRADHADRAGGHQDRRRTAARGRRDRARHRLPAARPHRRGGDRRTEPADAARGVEGRPRGVPRRVGQRLPQHVHALRPEHQPGPPLDPVHGGVPDRLRPQGPRLPRRRPGAHPGRRSRGAAALQRGAPAGPRGHRLRRRLRELVQDGRRACGQQLARRHRGIPGAHRRLRAAGLQPLGVLSGQVGDAAGWWVAVDAGVGSVVVVPVQPVAERRLPFDV
ncbi:putative Cyclohexanone monooxygenase [Streptomyces misionensis JCM 4497]